MKKFTIIRKAQNVYFDSECGKSFFVEENFL